MFESAKDRPILHGAIVGLVAFTMSGVIGGAIYGSEACKLLYVLAPITVGWMWLVGLAISSQREADQLHGEAHDHWYRAEEYRRRADELEARLAERVGRVALVRRLLRLVLSADGDPVPASTVAAWCNDHLDRHGCTVARVTVDEVAAQLETWTWGKRDKTLAHDNTDLL